MAGSVVGQWGANYGQGRGASSGNRTRGTRAGKKNKEKKEKLVDDNKEEKVIVKEVLSKDKKELATANEE